MEQHDRQSQTIWHLERERERDRWLDQRIIYLFKLLYYANLANQNKKILNILHSKHPRTKHVSVTELRQKIVFPFSIN